MNEATSMFVSDPKKNKFELASISPLMNFMILPEILEDIINFTLGHPNVQNLMNEKFDVVIVETFNSEALMGKRRLSGF